MVYVRVLCGVRYVSMGLRQEEDIIQPMERMTSSGDRHQDCRVQVQVEHHEEIKCLKLAIHCGVNGLVKMCRRVAHPQWSMGEQSSSLHQPNAIKKGCPS